MTQTEYRQAVIDRMHQVIGLRPGLTPDDEADIRQAHADGIDADVCARHCVNMLKGERAAMRERGLVLTYIDTLDA